MDPRERAAEAAAALAQLTGVPRHDATVVIGSGWDAAAESLGRVVAQVPVGELPGFVVPVAPGHRGVVRSYDLDGMAVLVFFGRTHIFEGLGAAAVAHPVRVGAATGARVAVLTNATGSLRADWSPGTGVLIRDHLNWTRVSPIVGAHFVDLTDAWSPRLRAIARSLDPELAEGVYALMPGPSVQSAAETRMLRGFGADLVGMSVAIEAIAVREAGLELLGLSIASTIEDSGVALDPITVLEIAHATARRLGPVIAGVLEQASPRRAPDEDVERNTPTPPHGGPEMTGTQVEIGGLALEQNGINVIAENERKGKPSDLFWPWCAANISVLAISYGAFVMGFGISFWQATAAGLIGVVASFALCGVVALAGKRGSAPTMVLSRAAFGVTGNTVPTGLSWILLVGWETVLASLSTLATSTVFTELGWGGGTLTKIVAFLVTAALVIGAGVLGFDVIMRLQTYITLATAVLTVGFVALTLDKINWSTVSHAKSGSLQSFVGALALVATGFGVGWVNTAADYSRYLPRRSSGKGVFGWTTLGGAAAPVVLLVYGIALAASSAGLSSKIGADPIGALTTVLPTWYLVPFAIVAVLGLVGGAVLDIYSSGLALLTLGLKVPRYAAAGVDGVIMVLGSIYVVFIAKNFIAPFEAFLITVGVPIAAWAGVFVADLALRRSDYADLELYDARGRYGAVHWPGVALVALGTFLGWGMVTTTAPDQGWLTWQGYLLGPIGMGGKSGAWAYANVGVFVAFAVGLVGWLLLGRSTVARQEATP